MNNDYWLSIELGACDGSAALHQITGSHPTLIIEKTLTKREKHSEEIIPIIDSILGGHGIHLNNVSHLITSSGPGSFTGLRVSHSVLKAFALVLNVPISIIDNRQARALSFCLDNPTYSEPLYVVTTTNSTQCLVTQFFPSKDLAKHVELADEWLVRKTELLDLPKLARPNGHDTRPTYAVLTDFNVDKTNDYLSPIFFPASAQHLGRVLKLAKSVITANDLQSVAMLQPSYFSASCHGVGG